MEQNKVELFKLPPQAQKVHEGIRWNLYHWEQKQFDGTTKTYEVAGRLGTILVIPVLPSGEVVIEKERQAHQSKSHFTIVAGGLEEGEDPFVGARRETEEEIGMIFSDYTLVLAEEMLPGTLWYCYTFIATGFQKEIPQALDGGEEITPLTVTPEKLLDMSKNKELHFRTRFIEDFLIKGNPAGFLDAIKNPKKYEVTL